MSALMIIVAVVHDRPVLLDYAARTAALVARLGGRYRLRVAGGELLEGDFGAGASALIIEWPDKAAARRFWEHADYAPLKAMRAGKADVQVLLVEGSLDP